MQEMCEGQAREDFESSILDISAQIPINALGNKTLSQIGISSTSADPSEESSGQESSSSADATVASTATTMLGMHGAHALCIFVTVMAATILVYV